MCQYFEGNVGSPVSLAGGKMFQIFCNHGYILFQMNLVLTLSYLLQLLYHLAVWRELNNLANTGKFNNLANTEHLLSLSPLSQWNGTSYSEHMEQSMTYREGVTIGKVEKAYDKCEAGLLFLAVCLRQGDMFRIFSMIQRKVSCRRYDSGSPH